MWEKCVGCGEGLFAGDAFCGNCGRPVTPAVPAAREPDGLGPAPHAAPAADPAGVRILPAAHDPRAASQARPGPPRPVPAAQQPILARTDQTAPPAAAAPDPRAALFGQPAGPAPPRMTPVSPGTPRGRTAPAATTARASPPTPACTKTPARTVDPRGARRRGFPGPTPWTRSATPAT